MTMDLDVLTESLAKLQQKYDIESFIGKLFYHVCVDIKKVDEVDKACAFLRSFLNKYTFKTEQLKSATWYVLFFVVFSFYSGRYLYLLFFMHSTALVY